MQIMSTLVNQISTHAHQARHAKRRRIHEILALSHYLPKYEQTLIQQVYEEGLPVARLAHLYQQPPRMMKRRIDLIVKRMSNKLFRFVAMHEDTLPIEVRPTARHVVLQGMSLRRAAKKSGRSLHVIRQHMNTVRATARLFV